MLSGLRFESSSANTGDYSNRLQSHRTRCAVARYRGMDAVFQLQELQRVTLLSR